MRFVQGDVAILKRRPRASNAGVKAYTMDPQSTRDNLGTCRPEYMLVVLEVVDDDLVKVCNLNGYDERIFPIKALKPAGGRHRRLSKGRR